MKSLKRGKNMKNKITMTERRENLSVNIKSYRTNSEYENQIKEANQNFCKAEIFD